MRLKKIKAAHLKPETEQVDIEEQDNTPVAVVTSVSNLGEMRKDTTRPPTFTCKQEEPTSNSDQKYPVEEDTTMVNVNADLNLETETSDTAAAAILEQEEVVDLESGMVSCLEDQNSQEHYYNGILELPEYSVSNVCAICLDAYTAGEMVVWSSNAECQHAFHQDCILDCFVNLKDDDKTPCPCCRQDFVPVLEKMEQVKKKFQHANN